MDQLVLLYRSVEILQHARRAASHAGRRRNLGGEQFGEVLKNLGGHGVAGNGRCPGVTTRGDTRKLLDEGLWAHIPWEIDPNDLSQLSVNPEDVPIIEAYVRAQLVYYRAALGYTTLDDPDFTKYVVGGGDIVRKGFESRKAKGLKICLGRGISLRPYLIGDHRTPNSAVIFDCNLSDEQEIPIEGGTAKFGEMKRVNLVVEMALDKGQWKLKSAGLQDGVCL